MKQIERLYRDLAETSNDLIWAVDADGRITFLSSACRKIYGREPEEMIGRSFLEFVPPDQYQKDLRHFTKALQSGQETVDYISRVYRKDGSVVTLSANARIVYDDSGRVIGGHGISRDMTERLRAREAQETSDRQQRELVAQLETERARVVAAQAGKTPIFTERLDEEIQLQRLRVFKATMRTVQEIVNNLLNGFQLVRLEAGSQLPAQTLTLIDQMIEETSGKLKALGELETVNEKQMSLGLGIDYPGSV